MEQYWKQASLFPLIWHQFDHDAYVVYFQDTGNTHKLDENAAYILKLIENGTQTESAIIAQINKDNNLNTGNGADIEQYVRQTLNHFVISQLIT